MPRERIVRGTVGAVSVVPIGYAADDDARAEITIPQPRTDGGDPLPYPKGVRIGQPAKVQTPDGTREYVLTRWRGLARAVDADGTEYMIRRWRGTKAAAEAATRRAAQDKLAELARARQAAAEATLASSTGDTTTTVADLVRAVQDSPEMARLSAGTRYVYRSAAKHITDHAIGAMLPRVVDVATVRSFLADAANLHGTGGAKHARAVLSRAFDLAVGTRALKVPVNPVAGTRNAVPHVRVRNLGIDHSKAPTDAQVARLLAGLTRDPDARAWYPGHARRTDGRGNPLDIADLAAVLFATGARLGEVAAVRWQDVDLDSGTVMISGTLVALPGAGTTRQNATKTKGSTRLVPLAPWALAALRRRARRFRVDTASALPVFGSPQRPGRWRDRRNLSRAVAMLFARHGIDFARGHAGRKWRVTSLVERGVPVHKVSDLVGHASVQTTTGYLGRGRQTDHDVRVAL